MISILNRPLTIREKEVMELIAKGLKNREIAEELHVNINTVKTHLLHIYRKLGVTTRLEAMIRWTEPNVLVNEAHPCNTD